MEGCRETACTSCAHRKVCKLSKDFMNAQQAVSGVMVGLGEGRTKRLCDFDYIKPVNLQCNHYYKEFQGGAIR